MLANSQIWFQRALTKFSLTAGIDNNDGWNTNHKCENVKMRQHLLTGQTWKFRCNKTWGNASYCKNDFRSKMRDYRLRFFFYWQFRKPAFSFSMSFKHDAYKQAAKYRKKKKGKPEQLGLSSSLLVQVSVNVLEQEHHSLPLSVFLWRWRERSNCYSKIFHTHSNWRKGRGWAS